MKKLLLIFPLGLCITATQAQDQSPNHSTHGSQKWFVGIQAGASFYYVKETFGHAPIRYGGKTGFTAGVVSSATIGSKFSFMPSLNFTQKGGTYRDGFKLTLNYIELPLNFVYHTNGSSGIFFFGAGPDLAFGVGGTEKFDGQETDIHFGTGDDEYLKPFEFSASILAGYKLRNGLFFAANYNPGISNIATGNAGVSKFHNHGSVFRIGYLFNDTEKTLQ